MDRCIVNTVQYSNGQFYGKESNEITKTLLCVMIKLVCGKYRDIVAMVLIINIDANKTVHSMEKLHIVLSDIGFVVTMTDGHLEWKIFQKAAWE